MNHLAQTERRILDESMEAFETQTQGVVSRNLETAKILYEQYLQPAAAAG